MVTVTNIVILILTNIAATLQVPEYAIVVGCTSISNNTMKFVLSSHSKIDKTKVLKPCDSSMQVESIANEHTFGAIKEY